MNQKKNIYFEYLLLIVLSLFWGGSFTLIKVALMSYPPFFLVAVRMTFGGLLVFCFALARQDEFPKTVLRWGELFVQGLLQGAVPFALISWGEQYIDSGMAGVLNSTPPIFVFIISVFILGTATFNGRKFLGVVLGFAGVLFLTMARFDTSFSNNDMVAVIAVTLASASYACGALYGRRFSDQSPFVTAACSLLLASTVMWLCVFTVENPHNIEPKLYPTLALIALTVLSTAAASIIFFRLLKTLGPLPTSSNSYMKVIFSVLLGVLFFSEPFNLAMGVSILLIFVGLWLVTSNKSTSSRA